ncbi:MAG: glutathione synthetase [Sandaracinus sp.]|nr:glutathione synthetase [Sandaracinus sp.]|tara:strand:+ start:873 stop:1916 length:1044 start_codon:yes stop_codon:yes gene_type:complete
MKIGFVVNAVETEGPTYTTVLLARVAESMGHEAWFIGVADFIYDPSGSICARAVRARKSDHETIEAYLEDVQGPENEKQRIIVDQLDVLMLRNDPAEDAVERPWAQTSGILFGQLAAARGVLVVNDPMHLADAINKTYFQHFPEEVRPRTCISRDPGEIRSFIESEKGHAVIKPLQGSGGQGVFIVKPDLDNLNPMIEAVTRDGYAIVQEYLPEAVDGDIRLFVLNGRPLRNGDAIAALRRVAADGDARSNLSAGGSIVKAEIDERAMRLVELVRPKLVRDGMYLVGLDVVGDKLMEINVFSPGGLHGAEETLGVTFMDVIVRDLERKVRLARHYGAKLPNEVLATL